MIKNKILYIKIIFLNIKNNLKTFLELFFKTVVKYPNFSNNIQNLKKKKKIILSIFIFKKKRG